MVRQSNAQGRGDDDHSVQHTVAKDVVEHCVELVKAAGRLQLPGTVSDPTSTAVRLLSENVVG